MRGRIVRGSNGSFVDLGSSHSAYSPPAICLAQPADHHPSNNCTMAVEVWRQSQLSTGGDIMVSSILWLIIW